MNLLSTGRQFLIVVLLAGCGEAEQASWKEVRKEVNTKGRMTDEQAESLGKVKWLTVNGLTSITDEQAESLSKVRDLYMSKSCGKLVEKYKNPPPRSSATPDMGSTIGATRIPTDQGRDT